MTKYIDWFLVTLFIASLASIFWEDSLLQINKFPAYLKVSKAHLLGSDALGRDYFTMLLVAFRTTIFYGFYGSILTVLVALTIAFPSYYFGSYKTSEIIKTLAQIVESIPFLPIAITMSALLSYRFAGENRILLTITIIALISWPRTMLLLRVSLLDIEKSSLMHRLRAIGYSKKERVYYYYWGAVKPILLWQLVLQSVRSIGNESILSFLGLGVSDGAFSLGSLLNNANRYADFTNMSFQWLSVAFLMVVLNYSLYNLAKRWRKQ